MDRLLGRALVVVGAALAVAGGAALSRQHRTHALGGPTPSGTPGQRTEAVETTRESTEGLAPGRVRTSGSLPAPLPEQASVHVLVRNRLGEPVPGIGVVLVAGAPGEGAPIDAPLTTDDEGSARLPWRDSVVRSLGMPTHVEVLAVSRTPIGSPVTEDAVGGAALELVVPDLGAVTVHTRGSGPRESKSPFSSEAVELWIAEDADSEQRVGELFRGTRRPLVTDPVEYPFVEVGLELTARWTERGVQVTRSSFAGPRHQGELREIELEDPGPGLEVRLVAPGGAPHAGKSGIVRLSGHRTSRPLLTFEVGSDGRAEWFGYSRRRVSDSPDALVFELEPDSGRFAPLEVQLAGWPQEPRDLGVVVVPELLAVARGFVLSEDNAPVVGAELKLEEVDPRFPGAWQRVQLEHRGVVASRTGTRGDFEVFAPEGGGPYRLVIDADGYQRERAEVVGFPMRIVLSPSGSLSGGVLLDPAIPASTLTFEGLDARGETAFACHLREDGSFRVSAAPPGRYRTRLVLPTGSDVIQLGEYSIGEGEETAIPPVDLRDELFVHTIRVLGGDAAPSSAVALSPERDILGVLDPTFGVIRIVTQAASVDVTVEASGFQEQTLPDLRGDVEIVLLPEEGD